MKVILNLLFLLISLFAFLVAVIQQDVILLSFSVLFIVVSNFLIIKDLKDES